MFMKRGRERREIGSETEGEMAQPELAEIKWSDKQVFYCKSQGAALPLIRLSQEGRKKKVVVVGGGIYFAYLFRFKIIKGCLSTALGSQTHR